MAVFARWPKNGRNNEVTVFPRWPYKAGFHCTMYLYLLTSFSLTDNSLVDGLLWRKTA